MAVVQNGSWQVERSKGFSMSIVPLLFFTSILGPGSRSSSRTLWRLFSRDFEFLKHQTAVLVNLQQFWHEVQRVYDMLA